MPPRVLASGPKPCGGKNYAYAINTKYDSIRYLLKPSFTHGSCASSSSELFLSPKQSGNDSLKSFPPGIKFIATSSWSIKCLHLKKNSLQSLMQNLVTELFARHGGMLLWHSMAVNAALHSECFTVSLITVMEATRWLSTEFLSTLWNLGIKRKDSKVVKKASRHTLPS